ncbi:DegT/DnrJ/EryC1/StrS family aminotransferase [Neptuniibacter sp. PT8_73]|uniref:DegT/DnrJ/EryC1/StrS family aminotransferase n=1 Tax=Neptuniibacter sp. PT8_73 TaxID=3398206 RepID=UPI0039F62D3E
MPIPVSKPYLPNREKLNKYIDQIYESGWLTNNGPLVRQLTKKLEEKFSVDNILLVANGTLALQIAYRTLLDTQNIETTSEALTTPFTFIATSNSLMWEGLTPVFADINKTDWCINPDNIAANITKNTKLIVPVHVFGNSCEIEKIDKIATEYGIKTVYDASHSFGIQYKDKNILQYGDASVISLHATKLFHTVEGALLRFKRKSDFEKAKQLINFGFNQDKEPKSLGINAKMNEVEAAFGLAAIDDINEIIAERQHIADIYEEHLSSNPHIEQINRSSNQAYLPVLFRSGTAASEVLKKLQEKEIEAKRYFFPSLDTLEHLNSLSTCETSQDIANRILCLPIYTGLSKDKIQTICNCINEIDLSHQQCI